MRKGSAVWGLVLVVVFGLLVYSSPAQAQWWKRKPGEELKEKIQEKMTEAKEKFMEKIETGSGGGPEFGFYYPALAALNSRVTGLGTNFPKLEGGLFMGGTWRYAITPELQIGYYGGGANYSSAGEVGTETYTTGVNLGTAFHGGLIAFKPKISQNFRIYGGVIIGATWTTYREDSGYRPGSGRVVKEWAGVGIGYLPFIGFQVKLNPLFALGADYGYMIASIPSAQMKPQAGTPYSETCPDVDLSGSFVKFGPQFHF